MGILRGDFPRFVCYNSFIMKNFAEYGVQIPEILLPKNVDLKSWSVIACDQYTQDKEYWANAKEAAGANPSTLNLIFPEVYLNDGDGESRIKKIHETMKSYLDSGIFTSRMYLHRAKNRVRTDEKRPCSGGGFGKIRVEA